MPEFPIGMKLAMSLDEEVLTELMMGSGIHSVAGMTPTEVLSSYLRKLRLQEPTRIKLRKLIGDLGWVLQQPEERIMSDEDRERAIELVLEQISSAIDDNRKDAADDLYNAYAVQEIKLVKNYSDRDLLDELGENYVTVDGKFLSDSFEAKDLPGDEALRLYMKYEEPELLAKMEAQLGNK